jgi:hypothetical protein
LVGTFRDFREESFLLIVYNLLWVVASIPGFLLLGYGAAARFLPFTLGGLVVLLPWPIATFALFHSAADIGERRAVGLGSFLRAGGNLWRAAYAWALPAVLVTALLVANARYYGSGASPLGTSLAASLLSSFMLTLMALWGIWQVLALAIYPHLSRPGLLAAVRTAGRLLVRQPAPVFLMSLLAALLAIGGFAIPPLGLLLSFSLIALLANRTVLEAASGAGLDELRIEAD